MLNRLAPPAGPVAAAGAVAASFAQTLAGLSGEAVAADAPAMAGAPLRKRQALPEFESPDAATIAAVPVPVPVPVPVAAALQPSDSLNRASQALREVAALGVLDTAPPRPQAGALALTQRAGAATDAARFLAAAGVGPDRPAPATTSVLAAVAGPLPAGGQGAGGVPAPLLAASGYAVAPLPLPAAAAGATASLATTALATTSLATVAGATVSFTTAAVATAASTAATLATAPATTALPVARHATPAALPPVVAGPPALMAEVAQRLANAGLGAASLAAVERALDDPDATPLANLATGVSPASLLPSSAQATPGAAVVTGADARPTLAVSAPPVEPGLAPGRLQLDLQTADGAPIRVDMTFDAAGGAQLVVHANSSATAGSLIERSAQLVDAMRDLGLAVDVDVRQGSGQPSGAAAGGFGGSAGSHRPTPDAVPPLGRAVAGVPVPAQSPARSLDISAALSFYA